MSSGTAEKSNGSASGMLLPYRDLLTKAAQAPELLTLDEHARLLPGDRAYLIESGHRLCARIDAAVAGIRPQKRRVGAKRQLELVELARRGKLQLFALPHEEQDAIENTPGLLDKIWESYA